MTEVEVKFFVDYFLRLEDKLGKIENALYNKINVDKVIDVSNDKVHMVKQIVKAYETPNGVVIQVR